MTERRALLLDFGGVVTRTLFESCGEIERHFGLARGSLAWHGPLDPARDALWRAVLDGSMSDGDYWGHRFAALGAALGRSLQIEEVIAAMCGADPNLAVRPGAIALVRKAKAARCRTGVLSNDLERIYGRNVISRLTILGDMDCIVDGSRSGLRKPSPEAYAGALAALGNAAEETVFVDDQPRNVEAATSMGMAGVAFDIRDPAASFRVAEQLLGID